MADPATGMKYPPKLSILTLLQRLKRGGLPDLVQTLIDESNATENPVTMADLYWILYTLGWFAPAGTFVAPPGTYVTSYKRYVLLEPGETVSVHWSACASMARLVKELRAEAGNLTAQASVRFALQWDAYWGPEFLAQDLGAPEDCDELSGVFELMENIVIPPGKVLRLYIINGNDNSEAWVELTGRMWDLP